MKKSALIFFFFIFFVRFSFSQIWKNLTPDPKASFIDLSILDSSTCYVAGWGGAIYKTTDGGKTWISMNSGITEHITSIESISSVVYAASENGKILRCSDGINWNSISIPDYSGNSIYFFNSFQGYFTGGIPGQLAKTTNGGDFWQVIKTNYGGIIKKVFFTDEMTGYAISNQANKNADSSNGIILKTTDGGKNWNVLFEEENTSLNSLYFTSEMNGYFVGDNGKIILTRSGGESFQYATTPVDQTIHSIHFSDESTGYAVGNKGTILKTINRGTSWSVINTPKEYALISVAFINDIGYILVAGNRILKTTTGGQ